MSYTLIWEVWTKIILHLWERPKFNLGTKTSKTWVGLLSWARNKLFASAWHFFCIDHKHHRWFIFSKTFCILKFGQFSLIPLLAQKLFFFSWTGQFLETKLFGVISPVYCLSFYAPLREPKLCSHVNASRYRVRTQPVIILTVDWMF